MKRLFKIFVGLVLLLIVAIGLLLFFFDRLIRVSIEQSGTYALDVETTLDEADFGFFSGRLDLDGLAVANPEGFRRDSFLTMGTVACQVKPESLASDVIVVPLIELADLTLDVERNAEGTNYGIILENLQRFESEDDAGGGSGGGQDEGEKEQGESDGSTTKKFMIERIALANISVTVNLLPSGGDWTDQKLEIPTVELRDVGTAEAGATPTDIARALISALLEATVEAGNGLVPADLLQDVSAKLEGLESKARAMREDVEKRADDLEKEAQGKIDDKVEETKGEVEDAVEGAKEDIEKKLGRGLDGLLGGDKKKKDDG